MDWKNLEKIFDHLDRCRQQGKDLQLNINEDLPKILPLPRKLILDFFSLPFPSTIFRISTDQQIISFESSLGLCQDQSCRLTSCDQLHLCEYYIFNEFCSEWNSKGKCSKSHSLLTQHNEQILRKFHLFPKDEQTFAIVSRIIRLSSSNLSTILLQTRDKQRLTDQFIDQCLDQHKSLVKNHQSINSYTILLSFDDDEVASMMENFIKTTSSKSLLIVKDPSKDLLDKERSSSSSRPAVGRGRGRQQTIHFSTPHLPPTANPVMISSSVNSIDRISRKDSINYPYRKAFTTEHLSYFLGPGRKKILQRYPTEILSYLSLAYCRVNSIEQGKEIEQFLFDILPDSLNMRTLNMKEDLSLLVSSSAAEKIFEQNQTHFAIRAESTTISLNIEMIDQSPSPSNTNSSDGKFHISSSGSTIDVISADISDIQVDLMICIRTSHSLCENVLRRAGDDIKNSYERSNASDAMHSNGGLTSARKILFVPWETTINTNDTITNKKSLAELVHWCIDQAATRNYKSISFPPIGTGQLGLDPSLVCEAMISAAVERLHRLKMHVVFVIYPSTGIPNEDECYQIFRIYLNSLLEQNQTSSQTKSNEIFQRRIPSKRIIILSESTKTSKDEEYLIRSLEDIIEEKTLPFSLIKPSFIDQIDQLVDICITYHVIPRVNLREKKLILRGDRCSLVQCFHNLCDENDVYQYTYQINGEDEMLNPFLSLNIDQSYLFDEDRICLKDNDQCIFYIDLKNSQLKINENKQSWSFQRKKFDEHRISLPSSWSKSSLSIRTIDIPKSSYRSLQCYELFDKSLSLNEWDIEQIQSIENVPLYIHYLSYNRRNSSEMYYHGCSYSSVQSIIHYGFHWSNSSEKTRDGSIRFNRDALSSHIDGTRRSIDGKYYLFVVQIAKKDQDCISLSNEEIHLTLPTHLIIYKKRSTSI